MPVGWLPRGGTPDPHSWAYDLTAGKWVSPDDAVRDDHQIVEMPLDFDPRTRGQGVQVVLSPPGTAAPPGALSYTPVTKDLHGPGGMAPIDLENLSVILAPRPGPPAPPLPPAQPAGGAPAMGAAGVAPPSPAPGQPPPALGATAQPTEMLPPPSLPGQMAVAPPPAPMASPGQGRPPNLYATKAHAFLASLLGQQASGAAPVSPGAGQDRTVGAGQDQCQSPSVGVGADSDVTDLQTQALQGAVRQHVGTPYVLGGNDLSHGIDCSGFVNQILKGFGANIVGRPTTTTYRNQLSSPISWDEIRPGDILLSAANPSDPVSGEHMALYVGGGQMAESRGGEGVRVGPVTGTRLRPYRMLSAVPGLQDATMLAQQAVADGPTTVTPTSPNNPMRLMSAQDQGDDPRTAILRMAQQQFGDDGARAVGAVMTQEGNINRLSRGDNGRSAGPFQFYGPGGQLDAFARDHQISLPQARTYVEQNPVEAAQWAFDHYMGQSLRQGIARGHSAEQLVTDIVRGGQNPRANVADYTRHLPSIQLPGVVTATDDDLWDRVPDTIRNAALGLVDRALGVSTAYAAEESPQPATDYGPGGFAGAAATAGWNSQPLLYPTANGPAQPVPAPSAVNSGALIDQPAIQAAGGALRSAVGPPMSAVGSVARGAADVVGATYGNITNAINAPTTAMRNRPPAPAPSPPSVAPAPRAPMQDFSPGMGRQTPEAPHDPRLDARDPLTGQREWGPAGTVIPFPGMPWMPWVIYGDDEGDGLGRIVQDPQAMARAREGSQAAYIHGLDQAARAETSVENRAQRAHEKEVAQQQWAEKQADLQEQRAARNQATTAAQALQDQRLQNETARFWATLQGPEGAQVARQLAPGGLIVDREGQVMIGLDESGQPTRTWALPGVPAKAEHIPGRGYYSQTTNPQTRQIEMTPMSGVPGGQTVVDRTVLGETPRGLEAQSVVATPPSIERWTDPWGREFAINRATGERILFNEGAPKMEQRGRITYNVPPPETPRYVPPMFRPTTYGRPEVPWASQQSQLPPGVIRTPDGGYIVPNSLLPQPQQQIQPPQFVQPQPADAPDEPPEPGYEMSGNYA